MQLEIEQKYPLRDATALKEKLAALGASAGQVVTQCDTYFNHPGRDFAQTDEALRIRRVGEKACVTYKGPKIDTETKTRREIELPLGPIDETADGWPELLTALGFCQVATVSKTRENFRLTRSGFDVEVCIDQVAQVGLFAELEIVADQSQLDAAKAVIAELEAELRLTRPERRSYLEMLLGADEV